MYFINQTPGNITFLSLAHVWGTKTINNCNVKKHIYTKDMLYHYSIDLPQLDLIMSVRCPRKDKPIPSIRKESPSHTQRGKLMVLSYNLTDVCGVRALLPSWFFKLASLIVDESLTNTYYHLYIYIIMRIHT